MDTSSSDAVTVSQPELFTPTTSTSSKRLVLEYVRGDWKGLFQIAGVYDVVHPHIPGPFQIGNGPVVEFASLIRVRSGWMHYREVPDRATLTGRLGEYMPGSRVGDFDKEQR